MKIRLTKEYTGEIAEVNVINIHTVRAIIQVAGSGIDWVMPSKEVEYLRLIFVESTDQRVAAWIKSEIKRKYGKRVGYGLQH